MKQVLTIFLFFLSFVFLSTYAATELEVGQAANLKMGPFLDEDDGKTVKNGLAGSLVQAEIRLSLDGGNFAQKNDTSACTFDEEGWYDCPINATDTANEGSLLVAAHVSGALPVWGYYTIAPSNTFDAARGTDVLQVDAVEISSASGAADNLEDDYDVTGYSKTASSIATTVSCTDVGATGVSSIWTDRDVEGALNAEEIMSLVLAWIGGETTGSGTSSITFRNQADDGDRISVTVTSGDRTSVTLTPAVP